LKNAKNAPLPGKNLRTSSSAIPSASPFEIPGGTTLREEKTPAPGGRWDGSAWCYGDDVDTDVIIPARYLVTSDPKLLGPHCLEDLDPSFASRVAPGDVVVGGENFGCGSSREHAPLALKGAGVSCVVAASFARIFFRNALNVGLPILICPEGARHIAPGDRLRIDLAQGTVENLTRGARYSGAPFPSFLQELVASGGIVPYVRRRLAQKELQEARP